MTSQYFVSIKKSNRLINVTVTVTIFYRSWLGKVDKNELKNIDWKNVDWKNVDFSNADLSGKQCFRRRF